MAGELQFLDYDGLSQFKGSLNGVDIVTTAGDGNAYTATVPGITALKAGISFTIIPHTASTKTLPTLNLNDLGAKVIRRRLSNSTTSTAAGSSAGWLAANKPIEVMYDGTFWIAKLDVPNANDIYGTVAIEKGGTGGQTAEAARTNLEAQKQHGKSTVTLTASGWANNTQTVNVTGVTEDNTVFLGAATESKEEYMDCEIKATAQGGGTLTFTCGIVPANALTVNVAIFD